MIGGEPIGSAPIGHAVHVLPGPASTDRKQDEAEVKRSHRGEIGRNENAAISTQKIAMIQTISTAVSFFGCLSIGAIFA